MPIVPWVSVNSMTMLVIRSALDNKPARLASRLLVLTPLSFICVAIKPANAEIRSTRAFNVPSCFWNTTVSKLAIRDSSVCFLSVLKKNSASARRGRTTFSLPEIICCGSFDSMLVTKIKLGNNLPLLSNTGKYF